MASLSLTGLSYQLTGTLEKANVALSFYLGGTGEGVSPVSHQDVEERHSFRALRWSRMGKGL